MTNKNAPTTNSSESAQDQRHFSPFSTATDAQRQRILDALRTGPQTSYDLRRMGCYQSAARILELRRMGYEIETELVTLYDRDGFMHPRCARYHLTGEVAQ